jgi:transketolase
LSYGSVLHYAVQARKSLLKTRPAVGFLNFASIKPLDAAAIAEAAKTGLLITAEDHHVDTGLGARVSKY